MALIKAGTYRINDTPTKPGFSGYFELPFTVLASTVSVTAENVDALNALVLEALPEAEPIPIGEYVFSGSASGFYLTDSEDYYVVDFKDFEQRADSEHPTVQLMVDLLDYNGHEAYHSDFGWQTDEFNTDYHYIAVTRDTDVVDEFSEWFKANTEKATATVTYRGNKIAPLFSSENATTRVTLHTKGTMMSDDIAIEASACDKVHVIEVDELPTENIVDDAVYKISKTVFADIILVTEDYTQSFADLFATGQISGGLYAIPTKTTENIVVTDDVTYSLYYIEDEKDIFVYVDIMGNGSPMWIPAATAFDTVNNGKISYISEATELGCYYMLDTETTFHQFNKANKGLIDVITDSTSLATYGVAMGMTYSFNNVPTRPSEGMLESDPYNNVFHFYYMEDENDISLYMGGSWIPGAVLANSIAGGELIFVTDIIHGMHRDNNVYALISDGWSDYILPSGNRIIEENGVYSVRDKEYIIVDVEETVPDGYVYVDGVREITRNGEFDVTYYKTARVNVPPPPPPPAPENCIVLSEDELPTNVANGSIAFVLGGEVNA